VYRSKHHTLIQINQLQLYTTNKGQQKQKNSVGKLFELKATRTLFHNKWSADNFISSDNVTWKHRTILL
jgi:hypothetical protein